MSPIAAHPEHLAQVLLEEVRTKQRLVELLDGREGNPLLFVQVCWVLEEGEAGLLYGGGGFRPDGVLPDVVPHLSPNRVHGVRGPLHDVERVHTQGRVWTARRHDVAIGAGRIGADELNEGRALGPKLVEEAMEVRLVAPRACPQKPAGVVIDNDRQVAVPSPIAHVVNPDAPDAFKGVMAPESFRGDSLNNRANASPGDAQQRRHGRLVGSRHEPCGDVLEGPGRPSPRPSPGNMGYDDAMLGAAHTWCIGFDIRFDQADVGCSPAPTAPALVVAWARSLTLPAATGLSGLRPYVDHKVAFTLTLKTLNDGPLDAEQARPYAETAHSAPRPRIGSWQFPFSGICGVRICSAFVGDPRNKQEGEKKVQAIWGDADEDTQEGSET